MAAQPVVPGFEIETELGRGGMGVVYRARDAKLNRTVALKMLLGGHFQDPIARVRFRIEAEAVAQLRHPNVVQVLELGECAGLPYLALEYAGGGNLAGVLKKNGRFQPPAAAVLIAELADGVAAAHAHGVVHRDLKPGNVLLTEGGVPKVADFGLARVGESDLTQTGALIGTPSYMAPEQAAGRTRDIGTVSDVWALGVILYELLTGVTPFQGRSFMGTLQQVQSVIPVRPRTVTPGIPRDLETICLKCLEKDAKKRYPTADALAADLRAFLAGRPIMARPAGPGERVWKWALRNPAGAALAGLVGILVVAGPPLVFWELGRVNNARGVAAEAKKAEEAATLAQRETEKARIAAEQLAAARELFALAGTARRRALDRPVGWTRDNLTDLRRAATLAAVDPEARVGLRSEAAVALLAADLRPSVPVARGFPAARVAAGPAGAPVAIGQPLAWVLTPCRVLLVDPVSGQTIRQLRFPAGFVNDDEKRPAPDGVRAITFSPDGRRLFVGTRESRVHRFDLDRPKDELAAGWAAFPEAVERLETSPDGKWVYGADRHQVCGWDAETGKELGRFAPGGGELRFVVEPGGGDLVVAVGERIHRLDPATLRPRGPEIGLGSNTPARARFAPGSRALVAGRDNWLRLYDPDASGFGPTGTLVDPRLRSGTHEEAVNTLAVHPTQPLIATAATFRDDRLVKVWELWSGRLVGVFPVPGTTPTNLAWSGDGRFLLATGPEETVRWELTLPVAQRVTPVQSREVEAAGFSADGTAVASVGGAFSRPGQPPERRLAFDPLDGPPGRVDRLAGLSSTGGPAELSVSPATGRVAITQAPRGLVFWQLGTPPTPPAAPRPVRSPRYSSDGSILWVVEDSDCAKATDAVTGAVRGTWSNAPERVFSGLSGLEAIAVGRTRAVVGDRRGGVTVLDDGARLVSTFPATRDPILTLAITPDDATAVAGAQSGRVRVMSLSGGGERVLPVGHDGGTTAVAVGRDGGYLVTGGKDRTVRVWQAVDGEYVLRFAVGDLPGPPRDLQFGPAGDRLLVLLKGEHAVRVWDLSRLRSQLTEIGLGW